MLSEHAHLAFEPVSRPHPKTLGAMQIDHYHERGYVAPLAVFSPAESADARAYFDGLLARRLDGRDAYALNGHQARCAGIWDLCTKPHILDLVEDIVGPDVVCWASHLFCKLAHDPKAVPWHRHAIHWHLAPARTVTVWLAIDDVDAGNSAMGSCPARTIAECSNGAPPMPRQRRCSIARSSVRTR